MKKKMIAAVAAAAMSMVACGQTKFSAHDSATMASEKDLRQSVEISSQEAGGACGGPAELRDPLSVPNVAVLTDDQVLAAVEDNLRVNIAAIQKKIAELEGNPDCVQLLTINRQLLVITSDMLSHIVNDSRTRQFTVQTARQHAQFAPPASRL